jgi:hypothetical protein
MTIFEDVGGWFSGAARDVYSEVLKPVGTKVWDGGVSIVNRVANIGEKTADAGINFATKEGEAINKFSETLANPIFLIGALVVGGIVLTKVMK